jgi:hypothetical protein
MTQRVAVRKPDELCLAGRRSPPRVYNYFRFRLAHADVEGSTMPNPHTSWNEVNPALPPDRIQVMGPDPTSERGAIFVSLLMAAGCNTFVRRHAGSGRARCAPRILEPVSRLPVRPVGSGSISVVRPVQNSPSGDATGYHHSLCEVRGGVRCVLPWVFCCSAWRPPAPPSRRTRPTQQRQSHRLRATRGLPSRSFPTGAVCGTSTIAPVRQVADW